MILKIYRFYLITLLSAISFQVSYGQDAYTINWKRELGYMSAGIAANGIGYLLFQDTPEISYQDYIELDPNSINSFDRRAFGNQSNQADLISDIFANGSIGLPLAVYCAKIKDPQWRKSSIMFVELVAINGAITNITKYSFRRTRPYVYTSNLQQGNTISRSGRASYISGHTSLSASNSFFAAALFQRAYPDSSLVPYVYGVAASVPLVTAIARVEAGKHFYTDVISGYIVGAGVAALVIHIHKRDDLQLTTGSNGVGLVWTF